MSTTALPDDWGVDVVESEAAVDFLEPRVRFAVADESPVDGIGDIEPIRERSDEIVEAISTPDGEACPHCGLAVPTDGPPICPRCGLSKLDPSGGQQRQQFYFLTLSRLCRNRLTTLLPTD